MVARLGCFYATLALPRKMTDSSLPNVTIIVIMNVSSINKDTIIVFLLMEDIFILANIMINSTLQLDSFLLNNDYFARTWGYMCQ